MTTDEIIELGLKAEQILANADVMMFFRSQMEDIKTAAFNTLPEHHKEREKLFFMHQGARDFIDRLTAHKNAAAMILDTAIAEEKDR